MKGIYPPASDQERKRIIELRRSGLSATRTAELMGRSRSMVCKVSIRAGIRKATTPQDIKSRIQRGTYKIGSRGLSTMLLDLPDEVLQWLDRIRPEGSSMSEMIMALITDAYHEENALTPSSAPDKDSHIDNA